MNNRLLHTIFRMLMTLGAILLSLCAIIELFNSRSELWLWLGKFSIQWWIIAGGLVAFYALVLGVILLATWFPEKVNRASQPIIKLRARARWLLWAIAIGVALIPTFVLLYTPLGSIFTEPYLRFMLLITSSALVAIGTSNSKDNLTRRENIFFGLSLVGSVYVFGAQISSVTNYPFSLGWSEGNRLYDYSVLLGGDRYQYPDNLTLPYKSFGRYLLWGLPFVIPNTPIWLHRLWNAVLATGPYVILGYLIAHWSQINSTRKWTFTLWALLFLTQGPIYTPLILSAIVVVIIVRPKHLGLSLIGVALAGYYATVSRWTWLPAPATWGVLIMLSEYEFTKGEKWPKNLLGLVPAALVAIAGLAAGMLANPKLFTLKEISSSTSFAQPLLWYRLIPSATYTEGILIGLLIAGGPLAILLTWLVTSKRWRMDWLQGLAYVSASLIFLVMGLVASVKIGGGNNLHNLDMFFVTLIILTGLMLRGKSSLYTDKWPLMAQGLLILVAFLPAWDSLRHGTPLQLPPPYETSEALRVVKKRVGQAQKHGEVLFMDQRQLLTFNYIQGIPLVPEYEKKYMMDQAMAGNSEYFAEFYQDLADKRFAMIVSNPLFTSEKGAGQSFGEENDAWVRWVSEPILCYYAPERMLPDFNIHLLVPRENPKNCP